MNNERVFTVKINGLDKSYQDVEKLNEALNRMNSSTQGNKGTRRESVQQDDKAFQKLARTLERIQQLETDVAREQIAADQRRRTRTRDISLEVRQQQASNNSIEQMRANLARLNNEWRNLDVNSDRFETVTNEINQLNEAIARNERRAGDYRRNVGNYENGIRSALGVNNEFAASILELSESAETGEASISSFFSNAGKSAQAFGKTLLGLLANPVFLAIAGIAGAGLAFKFWYDYNKGLEEATRLTKEFTGLTGNDLKAFRNEVQGVSDTFEKDFKETLEAANAVAKQFGISQQEALRLVKDGFIAGADANGEYLETLKEYPAFFKEAGISASEFIAITSETAKEGVFSDKGIDAIKEGSIRIRELTKSTSDALDGIGISSKKVQEDLENGTKTVFDIIKEVSEKLNELPPQSQVVGTAIADIFGGAGEDAGLQYLQTLKDIETDLDTVKVKSGELGAIQEKQLKANVELQNVISALFDRTGGVFESMIGKAKVFATESLISIIKGIIEVINSVIRLYNESEKLRTVIFGIKAAFIELFEVQKAVFKFVIESAEIIGDILNSAFTLDLDGIAAGYKRWASNTINIASGVADSIKNTINDVKDKAANTRIKPIEIPVNVVSNSGASSSGTRSGKTRSGQSTSGSGGSNKAKDNSEKELQDRLKKELEIRKKHEDSLIELIDDEFEKKEAKLKSQYSRQIDELKNQLETEKELSQEAKKNLNNIILNLEKKQAKELDELATERSKKIISEQKQLLDIQSGNIKNFYDDIKEKIKNSEVSNNGLIDVEFTRKNIEEIGLSLNEYIQMLEESKSRIEAYYDSMASLYDEDSIEYKKIQHEKTQALRNADSQIMQANDELTDNTKKNTNLQQAYWESLHEKVKEYSEKILNGMADIFDTANILLESQLDEANDKFDEISKKYDDITDKREESSNRIEELEEKLKNARGGRALVLREQINEEMNANKQLADQEKKLAAEKEKQEKQIAKKEKQLKKVQLAENIIVGVSNTALGITQALKTYPPPLSYILAAAVGVMGGLQVGVMASQIAKLEDGGLLQGKRHSDGGMRIQGSNIEVEGGEYVVNRTSTNKNLGLVQYINSQRRQLGIEDLNSFFSGSPKGLESPLKRHFETGGQLPTISTQPESFNDSLIRAVEKMSFNPVVSVVDIDNAQKNKVEVDSWTDL